MNSKVRDNILKWANTLTSVDQIAQAMGKEWKNSQLKVASEVVTLARKGTLDKAKAHNLLKGMPMEKFIDMPMESKMKGQVPMRNEKVITTYDFDKRNQ